MADSQFGVQPDTVVEIHDVVGDMALSLAQGEYHRKFILNKYPFFEMNS